MEEARGAHHVEGATSVRVAVRVRPLVPREVQEGCASCISVDQELRCVALGKDRRLTYDYVYPQDANQECIFQECVRPLVDAFMGGYNATVMAYGQTGSGKTYTMGLDESAQRAPSLNMDDICQHVGMAPRVIHHLFDNLEECRQTRWQSIPLTVGMTLLEIYNEDVRDLLAHHAVGSNSTGKGLALRENPDGVVSVSGARELQVHSSVELLKVLSEALAARATGQTSMNETSSRSHAICTLYLRHGSLRSTNSTNSSAAGDDPVSARGLPSERSGVLLAKLHLVDLAGSERTKRSTGQQLPKSNVPTWLAAGEAAARFREAVNINQGLLALGNVISALGDKRRWGVTHIPYRDSKLTRMLQDSLGGNSYTMLLACVSPADDSLEESLSTLKYAHRARNIRNRPMVAPTPASAASLALQASQAEVRSMQVALLRRLMAPLHGEGGWQAAGAQLVADMGHVVQTGGELGSMEQCEEALEVLSGVQLCMLTSGLTVAEEASGVADPAPAGSGQGGEDVAGEGGGEVSVLRAQLQQVVAELHEARQDLKHDERIFVEQQRELRAAQQAIVQLKTHSRSALDTQSPPTLDTLDTGTRSSGVMETSATDGVVVVGEQMAQAAQGVKEGSGGALENQNSQDVGRGADKGTDWDSGVRVERRTLHDAQLELLALMNPSQVSGAGSDEEVVLLGEVSEDSTTQQLLGSANKAVADADRDHLLAELASVQAQRDALEQERAAAEQQQQQQHEDFSAVREVLEERMRHLAGSIAAQEALIEALTAQEAQARQLNKACMERMAILEEEIASREQEVQTLRDALMELEDNLETRTKEEREEIRKQCEADICRAQAQINSLRRALHDAHRQQLDRDTQRSAARVHTLEAELKVLRSEQESLRRRLTERITAQERQQRAHAQEMSMLRRAAHTAQQRMNTLIEENKVHKAMARARGEEAVSAQKRVRQLQQELDSLRGGGCSPAGLRSPVSSRANTPTSTIRSLPLDSLDPFNTRMSPQQPWSSSHKRLTPPSALQTQVPGTPGSARVRSVSPGPTSRSRLMRAGSLTPYAEPEAAVSSEPVDVRLLLEQQMRALTAKHAAEERIQKLQQRQQQLCALRAELNLERAEITAALAVARANARDGLASGGHTRHNSRYASCEDPEEESPAEGVRQSLRSDQRAAPMSPSAQRRLQQQVQQQQAALADVDERLDAVSADAAYVDMVLREMERVLERAEGCGLELRRRLARMNAADTRAALHVALEQLATAHRLANAQQAHAAVMASPAPAPPADVRPVTADLQPVTLSHTVTASPPTVQQQPSPPPPAQVSLRPVSPPTRAARVSSWSMSDTSDAQPLSAAPRVLSPRPALGSPRNPSPSRLTASTECSLRPPALRQSLFSVGIPASTFQMPASGRPSEDCHTLGGNKPPPLDLARMLFGGTRSPTRSLTLEPGQLSMAAKRAQGVGCGLPAVTVPTAVMGAGMGLTGDGEESVVQGMASPKVCSSTVSECGFGGEGGVRSSTSMPVAPGTVTYSTGSGPGEVQASQKGPADGKASNGVRLSVHGLTPRNVSLVAARQQLGASPMRGSVMLSPGGPRVCSPARQSLRSPSLRQSTAGAPGSSPAARQGSPSPLRTAAVSSSPRAQAGKGAVAGTTKPVRVNRTASSDTPSLLELCSMILSGDE